MDSREILKFCLEKGLLLDKEVLNLFSETKDFSSVKFIIETIKNTTSQKIITKSLFDKNKEKVNQVFSMLPKENQKNLEKLKIKLGLSIEISKEIISSVEKEELILGRNFGNVRLDSIPFKFQKKPDVKDFVIYFRNRLSEMKNILQENPKLINLTSINKISGIGQKFSIIGIVSEKRVTKNKNIIFEIEDLTGKIKILINSNKTDLYEKAEEVSLDSVIGIVGSGNKEILFANDLCFPDSFILERKKSPVDESVLFIGDIHYGSKLFLEKSFNKFIDYLSDKNSSSEAKKIKYVFISGDLVTGVGNYPNQEKDLKIKNLEKQFEDLANFFKRIRKDITLIISPGNHDGVRIMEPQPLLDEKYAWPLYDLKNVILVGNPSQINIGAQENFSGFDVLNYHGFSFPYYADNVPKLMLNKAMNNPEEIMKYLLKNRHLAPAHASAQYFPLQKDALMIRNVPDIMVSAHTHKSAVSYYNNILLISTSCWEAMTPYQEKFGNKPDHCKVPMFNLKTRAIKILDFEE